MINFNRRLCKIGNSDLLIEKGDCFSYYIDSNDSDFIIIHDIVISDLTYLVLYSTKHNTTKRYDELIEFAIKIEHLRLHRQNFTYLPVRSAIDKLNTIKHFKKLSRSAKKYGKH